MHYVQPETVGFSSQRLARIDPVMQRYCDQGQVAGLSTLVARHGKVVQQGCYGLADLEAQRAVEPDTIWRIYSMSKPVTAVAALMLYERGLYGLHDPVSNYIPSFADGKVLLSLEEDGTQCTEPVRRAMTIKDLFRHTSGLIYGWGDADIDKVYQQAMAKYTKPDAPPVGTAEFIDVLASLPLAYHPGDKMIYSFAIDVLGRLVEVLSGKTFGQFLQDELFAPLGMVDTGFWVPPAKVERFAALYNVVDGLKRLDGPEQRQYFSPPAFQGGGGGLVSTLGDYARFAQMLVNGGELDGQRILSPSTVKLMGSQHLDAPQQACFEGMNKRGYGYGLGVRVMIDPSSAGTVASPGEFGWDGAASTWFMVDPANDLIAVQMIQAMPCGRVPTALRFQGLVYQALVS